MTARLPTTSRSASSSPLPALAFLRGMKPSTRTSGPGTSEASLSGPRLGPRYRSPAALLPLTRRSGTLEVSHAQRGSALRVRLPATPRLPQKWRQERPGRLTRGGASLTRQRPQLGNCVCRWYWYVQASADPSPGPYFGLWCQSPPAGGGSSGVYLPSLRWRHKRRSVSNPPRPSSSRWQLGSQARLLADAGRPV